MLEDKPEPNSRMLDPWSTSDQWSPAAKPWKLTSSSPVASPEARLQFVEDFAEKYGSLDEDSKSPLEAIADFGRKHLMSCSEKTSSNSEPDLEDVGRYSESDLEDVD